MESNNSNTNASCRSRFYNSGYSNTLTWRWSTVEKTPWTKTKWVIKYSIPNKNKKGSPFNRRSFGIYSKWIDCLSRWPYWLVRVRSFSSRKTISYRTTWCYHKFIIPPNLSPYCKPNKQEICNPLDCRLSRSLDPEPLLFAFTIEIIFRKKAWNKNIEYCINYYHGVKTSCR